VGRSNNFEYTPFSPVQLRSLMAAKVLVAREQGWFCDERETAMEVPATLEGLLLFVILWWFSRKPRPTGAVSGLFLLGYGVLRFLVEFTREPDGFLGLLALGWSMGQWLSLPMILGGIAMLVWAYWPRRAVARY